jgi:hypothetical protein
MRWWWTVKATSFFIKNKIVNEQALIIKLTDEIDLGKPMVALVNQEMMGIGMLPNWQHRMDCAYSSLNERKDLVAAAVKQPLLRACVVRCSCMDCKGDRPVQLFHSYAILLDDFETKPEQKTEKNMNFQVRRLLKSFVFKKLYKSSYLYSSLS